MTLKKLEDRIKTHEEQFAEIGGKSSSLNEELEQTSGRLLALVEGTHNLTCFYLSDTWFDGEQKKSRKLDSTKRVVYIAPLKAIAMKQFRDWKHFGQGFGLQVVELPGETAGDRTVLEKGQIIISTTENGDTLFHRWKQRQYIQQVRLFIVAELHLIGAKCQGRDKETGDLAKMNLKWNRELANHQQGSEASRLQTKLSTVEAEMEQTATELQVSNITLEDLTKPLHSQENNHIKVGFQITKDELQSVISKLEEQLTAESAKTETMWSKIEKLIKSEWGSVQKEKIRKDWMFKFKIMCFLQLLTLELGDKLVFKGGVFIGSGLMLWQQ